MKNKDNGLNLTSLDDIFGSESSGNPSGVMNIQLNLLYPPENHPFNVFDDSDMDELITSIKAHGVLSPGIARPRKQGGYELLSGNRRHHASKLLGLEQMPVFVRDYTDDEAILVMVDSNIQRTNLLPSEKAHAYRMKYDALKRQGQRNDLVGNETTKTAIEELEETSPDTKSQIMRFIRLSYLNEDLLDMVDKKNLPMNPAVEISYLKEEEQILLFDFMGLNKVKPSLKQAKELHTLSKTSTFDKDALQEIFFKEKTDLPGIKLSPKVLKKYFPDNYTEKEMTEIILSLLNNWSKDQ